MAAVVSMKVKVESTPEARRAVAERVQRVMMNQSGTLDRILSEVKQKADQSIALVLTRYLSTLLNPKIIYPSGTCRKHGELLRNYVGFKSVLTRARRNHSSLTFQLEDLCESSKTAYKREPCTCASSEVSEHDTCCCCGSPFSTQSACRMPIHLAYKQRRGTKK